VVNNHDLPYRPLISGTSIINARVNEPGTIGYVAQDNTGAHWIISCYHVLCEANLGPYVADEPIYQPAAVTAQNLVATTSSLRANRLLDCAAAKCEPGRLGINYQLGIGPTVAPVAPAMGMRVLKAGAESGVTEGDIITVNGNDVVIRVVANYPVGYEISDPGDSGSLWVEQQSRAPVALHTGKSTPLRAAAFRFDAVLAALSLSPL
jgi:hypothetical protein